MTMMMDQILSDGPDTGVAPPSGPLRLCVEGWKFRPHSYALVNQQQCLELLKRPGVALWHADAPLIPMLGDAPVHGLMEPAAEAAMRSIPSPRRGQGFDAVYRISYPYNFGPSASKAFVFATCEQMHVSPDCWTGGTGLFGEVVSQNDITVVTPSEWSREGFVRSGVDPARVAVVPHGIDPGLYRPLEAMERERVRKQINVDGRFVFLNISALTGNKNVGAVVAAFAKVVQKHPQAMLVIKGLDDLYRSDQWLQTELASVPAYDRWKAGKNMAYVGQTVGSDILARMYQTSDCYVSPYKSEGFNLPALEAMACGLPVIVPKGGCTDDFMTDDTAIRIPGRISDHDADGHTYIKTDVNDIAAAMERAITDGEFRARSLRAGPEEARKHTWAVVVDRLLSVMASTLKGNG